jgi:hypothetical protein
VSLAYDGGAKDNEEGWLEHYGVERRKDEPGLMGLIKPRGTFILIRKRPSRCVS